MRTPRRVPSSLLRYSPLAAALASAAILPAMAATYVVTDATNNSTPPGCPVGGPCSLYQAMQAAVSACDTAATIQFNMPGPFVIAPSFPLPSISNNCPGVQTSVTIDGTSQPGASANTSPSGFNANNVVVLDGAGFNSFGCVLTTQDFGYGQGALAIKGLQVRNFSYGGFATAICGTKVSIAGSEIYSNANAINLSGPGSVGGPAAADRNIIGNNTYTAVAVQGSVNIENNYIGTDKLGTASAPNDVGISLFNASGSTIKSNVVSGNTTVGISANNSSSLQVIGNVVGADANKAVAMGNGMGMDLTCVPGSVVSSNLVSGNASGGIHLTLSDGAQFLSNKIGVAGDGSSAMPNGGHGMHVAYGSFCGGLMMAKAAEPGGSNGLTIGSNTIASNAGKGLWLEAAGDANINGNTIRNNSIYGIMITSGTGNRITGNSIFANLDKNIDLNFYGGPLPNDDPSSVPPSIPPDQDPGPNLRQNHPKVLGVVQQVAANSTVVSWELYSTPNTTFPVEFYANSVAGVPAGQTHLAAPISATTNASGYFSTSTTLGGLHNNIAMLATDPLGNTSEFSAAVSVTPTPEVVVSPAAPTALSFPNTVVGASSSPQSVTLSSVGGAGYIINSFSTAPTCYGGSICSTSGFICSVGCTTGTPYAAGSSCSISVTFAPIATGPATDSFYICDNAPGSPRAVNLSGTAVPPPPPTVAPATQGFGTLQVGTVGSPQPFTFNNPAPVAVSVSSVTVTGPYQMTHNCLSSLPAGGSCTANVSFAPTAPGAGTGALAMVASSGTASATLSGTGSAIPPATIAPTSHDFGLVVANSVSAPQAFTITNPAATSIALSPFNVTPPFALQSTTCTSTMPANSSCVANVKFAPTAIGPASGSISATAGAGSFSASLTGTGAASPALTIAPTGYDFGSVPVGSAADTRFVLTNPATAAASLSTPLVNPPFSVAATTCSATLPPQGTCNVIVRFTPFSGGPTSGVLTVPSSSGNPSATLIGDGVLQANLSLSANAVDLGTLTLNAPAARATLSIGNTGNAPLRIQGITLTAPFSLTHACPPVLQPGESCTLTVELNPTELGTFTGSIALLTDAPGGSRSVAVTAAVQPRPEPVLRVTPSFIGFGQRLGATQSPTQPVTVINEGGAAATGLALSIPRPHFVIVNSRCGPTLAPGATCSAEVAFEPTGFGPKNGQLVVTSSNAPPAVVNLSGAGCRPSLAGGNRGSGADCGP